MYEDDLYDAESPIQVVLRNNGFYDDVECLLVPEFFARKTMPREYTNMFRAFDVLDSILDGSIQNIVVKVDPDVDGYTSAAIFASWLKEYAPVCNVHYVFSEGKCHGLNLDEIGKDVYDNADLIVVPDAGSDVQSLDNARKFVSAYPGAQVLIVDHHPMAEDSGYQNLPDGIVFVNSHYGEGNTVLTGAGMMYKLISIYTYNPKLKWEDHILKLCALGLIADVANLKDMEARDLAYEGLRCTREELERHDEPPSLIAALYEANRYSIRHGMNINAIGWYIAPPMNAVIRMGTPEDKRDLFKALVWGCNEKVKYTPTSGKNKGVTKDLWFQEDMARRAKNIKSRQDTVTRKLMRDYKQQISQEEIDTSCMIAVQRDKVDEKYMPLTGLIANKLAAEIKKPILLLTKTTDDEGRVCYTGSGRGYEPIGIADFKQTLQAAHDANKTEPITLGGHPNAFGYSATAEDLKDVVDYVNETYSAMLVPGFPVHYELESKQGIDVIAEDIGWYHELWGNGIEQPRFAVTHVCVPVRDVHCTENGQTIYFTCDGLQYSKKYCNRNEYSELMSVCREGLGTANKMFEFTVIGTFDTYEDSIGQTVPYMKVEKWNPVIREERKDQVEF